MTQKEYMEEIVKIFNTTIKENEKIFNAYCYNNHDCIDYVIYFKTSVKDKLGLKFTDPYHAHGIGNNNESIIYKEIIDEEGFILKKEIAEFYYCTGIFGGCYVCLTDLATKEKYTVSRAN